MYRSGKRRHSHRKLFAWSVGFVCLCVAATTFATHNFRTNTYISKPPAAVTAEVSYAANQTTQFSEPLFMIALPSDWKFTGTDTNPHLVYHFHSTLHNYDARWMDIYIDGVPANFGVNRVLPVQANGNQLLLPSTNVSDNCSNFTRTSAKQPPESTHGKWEGIDFYCDLANYERDVVGIGSAEGFNVVTLKGATAGTHQLFITYTDNNATADYSIFTTALKTLRLR